MAEGAYADFDLVIERAGEKFRARVINSPAGQASVEFGTLFTHDKLENFALRMGVSRSGVRGIDTPEMETAKAFGGRMFKAVFNGGVGACYLRSLDQARRQKQSLRIRLHIDVPRFHNLPWEYLYDAENDQFLNLNGDTPIIRYLELPLDAPEALAVTAPLKILVMIASPQGFPAIQVEEEWCRLNETLRPLLDRGLVILQRLEKPTLPALRQALRTGKPHILHFIGHGRYFEKEREGKLLLETETGAAAPVSADVFATALPRDSLRLVVLNACEGARTSSEDPFAGVAQTLVRKGIPAVIAMQFPIFEQAALTLAHEFYRALAEGLPVDAALSEARILIYSLPNDVEWGTPVLFMRARDGVLFRLQPGGIEPPPIAAEVSRSAPERSEGQPDRGQIADETERLLKLAKVQMDQLDWPSAAAILRDLLKEVPGHAEGQELLARAQAEMDRKHAHILELSMRGWYVEARSHLERAEWAQAIVLLEQVEKIQPDFEDAQGLLKQARAEKERAERLALLKMSGPAGGLIAAAEEQRGEPVIAPLAPEKAAAPIAAPKPLTRYLPAVLKGCALVLATAVGIYALVTVIGYISTRKNTPIVPVVNRTLTAAVTPRAVSPHTLTPSPPPVRTPAPGEILLKDDFSDPSSGWPVLEEGGVTTAYSGGRYVLRLKQGAAVPLYPSRDYTATVIEADATVPAAGVGYVGLFCRHQGVNNSYRFHISTSGNAVIFVFKDGTILNQAEGRYRPLQPGETVHLRADCQGPTMSFYVNGERVASLTDTTYTSGNIGLYASNETSEVEISFDNLIVRAPAAATPTPSPTPTLVPTATPRRVLYQTDFSAQGGWAAYDDEKRFALVSDGVYWMRNVSSADSLLISTAGRDHTDVSLEVDAENTGGTPNTYGLVCRYRDGKNYYFFLVTRDGAYVIGVVENGYYHYLSTDHFQFSKAIRTDGSNHLRADCSGSSLTFYANGELLASVKDATFSSGDVGFVIWSSDAGAEAAFDNFAVYQP